MKTETLHAFFDELEKLSTLGEPLPGGGRAAIMSGLKRMAGSPAPKPPGQGTTPARVLSAMAQKKPATNIRGALRM